MLIANTGNLGSATGTFPNSLGEAADALRELAQPSPLGEHIKVAISRAARRAGLAYWRAFDIWYRKKKIRLESFEADAIAVALERKRDEEARNELHELRTRLTKLESLLVQRPPSFGRAVSYSHRPLDGARGHACRAVAATLKK